MVAAGFAVLWIGYQQLIYGYVLLKGYNIRWRDLANPLDPYQWPPKGRNPELIPAGQLLPGSTAGDVTAASAAALQGGGGQLSPLQNAR
jgi:hypothetical protein